MKTWVLYNARARKKKKSLYIVSSFILETTDMNRIVHKDMLQNMFINVFDLLSESLNLWTDIRQHYLDQHVWVADDDQKSF